ncbi:MAG: hypothetical protein GYB64_00555, partial [Chloroflexi bacterium]|nr:hypothetical protein [Chloroflexota bacterium]
MSTITVTLDDQVNGERIQVNLDSTLPVRQVLDALAQLRQLSPGSAERPRTYQLIRVYNGDPLRLDLSLADQGVQPGEELILAEKRQGLDQQSMILLGLAGLGIVAIVCVAAFLIAALLRNGREVALVTETPDLTLTLEAGTATATSDDSGTPQPTADEAESTPTDTGAVEEEGETCTNDLAFVSDITVPDGTEFAPGESFTKTWRVQNTGTCEWTTNYLWIFIQGAQMGGPNGQLLGRSVPPGTQADISVNLRAPDDPGTYRGFWQMQTPEGSRFGGTPFVEIVVAPPTPTPFPQVDLSVSVDPESTVGPYDIVTITATAEQEVPGLLIVVTEKKESGDRPEIDRLLCEDVSECVFDFGGTDNTYA